MTARAELSAVATSLDDLAERVASIHAALTAAERDDLGADLTDVERTLGSAARRLNRALNPRPGRAR
ncbi:MAG: hypothetical protein ACRDZ8_16260 [Acidimicrobiales bacterium]